MKKNLHNIERWVRGLVGLALIGYGYTSSIAWFYLGAYPPGYNSHWLLSSISNVRVQRAQRVEVWQLLSGCYFTHV